MILWNFISYVLLVAAFWFVIMTLGRPLRTAAGRATITATFLWFGSSFVLGVLL